MSESDVVRHADKNIHQAVDDYFKHVAGKSIMNHITGVFINRLAENSTRSKEKLRELFSKSPNWNPELDAIVLDGVKKCELSADRIYGLAYRILNDVILNSKKEKHADIIKALNFLCYPNNKEHHKEGFEALERIAPKAYAPGKKLSRVFKSLFDSLGATDETAGSRFQKLYAQLSDELNGAAKKEFKLFISINPAHFLTMSNPKKDERGESMISCHSLNSTEYDYNNGCTGYAKDETSFIVFTVSDLKNPEALNNRKTSRQVFAYEPNNGVLLQSRMYDTTSGTSEVENDSALFLNMVQSEISRLEEAPNIWKTGKSTSPEYSRLVETNKEFGGYPDWNYGDTNCTISVRIDHENDCEPITVGSAGLCLECGSVIRNGLFCDICGPETGQYCDWCEEYSQEGFHRVRDMRGAEMLVCDTCFNDLFGSCDGCGEYYPLDYFTFESTTDVDGKLLCGDCYEELVRECCRCEKPHIKTNMIPVWDYDFGELTYTYACKECQEKNYKPCQKCGENYSEGYKATVYRKNGEEVSLCKRCLENSYDTSYQFCETCNKLVEVEEDGACPCCGKVFEHLPNFRFDFDDWFDNYMVRI